MIFFVNAKRVVMKLLNNVKSKNITKTFNMINSIKKKFVLMFVSIVMLMGALDIITYMAINNNIGKFNDMIDVVIKINSIINESKNIIEVTEMNGGNSYLSAYCGVAVVNPKSSESQKYKKEILDSISSINSTLEVLDKDYIKDKTSIAALNQTKRVQTIFEKDINDMIVYYENKRVAEIQPLVEKITRESSFLDDSAQAIILNELTIAQKEKSILKKNTTNTGMVIIIMIFAIGIGSIVFAYVFTRRIVGTISSLAKVSQSIAEGNLQIEELKMNSQDEIAILAGSFEIMADNLRILIKKLKKNSNSIASSSEMLKIGVEQNNTAISQVSETVQQVAFGAADQSEKSQETLEIINIMLDGNKKVYDNAQSVLKTSKKATSVASAGNEKMELLMNQIGKIESKISETQHSTENLVTRTGEIENILNSIRQIATQTNLLSLNAAIEAARAGEHGKGFSVVSEEIRKLALGATNATKEITNILKEIQSQSVDVGKNMIEGVEFAKQGTHLAKEAKESFGDIVGTSIDVGEQIMQINFEIEKMVKGFEKVEEMSNNIAEIAKKSSNGSKLVAASIEEQTASLQEILSSATELSEMASDLEKDIENFKT